MKKRVSLPVHGVLAAWPSGCRPDGSEALCETPARFCQAGVERLLRACGIYVTHARIAAASCFFLPKL